VRARALKYAALQAGKVGHTTPSTPLSWPGGNPAPRASPFSSSVQPWCRADASLRRTSAAA
jgi:hypothetical protein